MMIAEPWMNREPTKRDPLIEAWRVLNYWNDRKREHETGLAEATRECAAASERVATLSPST